MDLESKVMSFQFKPGRGISSHEKFYQKATLRSEIHFSGKIANLVFSESVGSAPQ